jgi:hypothetical protein
MTILRATCGNSHNTWGKERLKECLVSSGQALLPDRTAINLSKSPLLEFLDFRLAEESMCKFPCRGAEESKKEKLHQTGYHDCYHGQEGLVRTGALPITPLSLSYLLGKEDPDSGPVP